MDRDTKIEALVQLIPYVGGSLSTLYFGEKQRKKFERLEEFYKELAEDLENVKSSIASIDQHSEEELGALIEEINEKVENERIKFKKKYYRSIYKKSLIHPVKGDFNERKYFVDLISQFTELHFQIISILNSQIEDQPIPEREISVTGVNPSLIKGFIQQLDNSGIVNTEVKNMSGFSNIGHLTFNRTVQLTELGKKFHYYCISNK